MSSRWRPDFNPANLYFITTKAADYAHIFHRDLVRRLLLDTLDCFRSLKRWKLYCFVIMPNHFHLIAQCTEANPLSDVIRDYKRQSADRLIRHMKAEDDQEALDFLASKAERKDKQSYKVWEDGFMAKDVFSEDFLWQKLEYIHNNPCQPHWALGETPEEYPWSSARFYMTEQPCIIPVDDVRKLFG